MRLMHIVLPIHSQTTSNALSTMFRKLLIILDFHTGCLGICVLSDPLIVNETDLSSYLSQFIQRQLEKLSYALQPMSAIYVQLY